MTFSVLKFFMATMMVGSSALVNALPADLEGRAPMATVYTKCAKAGAVALTFDDGPYIYTKSIVDKLTAAGAKGTFFVNGNNYDCIYSSASVDRLKYAQSKGHQIASHTWAHANLASLSKSKVVTEMKKVDDALVKILGVRPAFVRPPYGSYNNVVREAAAERGQSLVIWDFDSGDSASGATLTKVKNAYTSLANRKPSSVLTLNHDTLSITANGGLAHALTTLKAKGYTFVTVAQCLGLNPYISTTSPKPRDSTWKC